MRPPTPAPKSSHSLPGLVAASIVVPLGLFALGGWQSHRQLYAEAEQHVRRQAVVLKEHAGKVLKANQVVMDQVNQRVRSLSWNEIRTSRSLWEDLKRIDSEFQQIDSIFLVDSQGMSALTTRAFPSPVVDFSDRDYFMAQRDGNGGAYVSASYIGKISRRRIFNQSIARASEQLGFEGVIGISAYVEDPEAFYAAIARPEDNAMIALLRTDGQALAGYPAPRPADVEKLSVALFEAKLDEALRYVTVERDGSRHRVSYGKVPDFPILVTYSMDEGVSKSAWHGYLLQWGLMALAAAVSLSGLAWLAVTRAGREDAALRRWAATYDDLAREVGRRDQAEAALLQTQKLEALGQLTGGVAHDFNNLLHILAGNLARAKERISDERAHRAISSCEVAIQRSEKLDRHLLACARRQPLEYEVFELNECLGGMEDVLRQAARGLVLRTELSEDLWPVIADPTQLELAVLNLVLNARDAMPDGGTIRISTSNRRLAKDEAEVAGEFVSCTVSDDGPGISADVLARVWERTVALPLA